MITYTQDEFKKKYGNEASNVLQGGVSNNPVDAFKDVTPINKGFDITAPAKEAVGGLIQTYGGGENGIANKLAQGVQSSSSDIQKGDVVKGVVKAGLRTAGDIAGTIYAPIGAAIQATGFNRVTDFIGTHYDDALKALTGSGLSDIPEFQKFAMQHPNAGEDFGRALNLVMSAGEKGKIDPKTIVDRTITDAKNFIIEKQGQIQGVISDLKQNVSDKVGNFTDSITGKILPESATIMNRVARLKPTDFNRFVEITGKTPGDYLTETGNFGTPDKIISNESIKFVNSMNEVDNALAKLHGTFQDGSVADALTGLREKALSASGENVKAPFKNQVDAWSKKYSDGGLTMEDINAVKRLYESQVKLGYNKLVNGDKVAQATNIDNALREWQINKAGELGFKNIRDLNKQTQTSKFIINKLGDQVIGQSGLNSVSLTDWIMLSRGDPTSVAGFLTKKFFSSKAVQAKIAELLNKGEIKKPITAEMGQTNVKDLPMGQTTPGTFEYAPISTTPPTTFELPANSSKTTSTNKTGDIYSRDLKTGKLEIIPKKNLIPPNQLLQETKATIDKKTIKNNIPSTIPQLSEQAKNYKTAEEFVKAQGETLYHGGTADIKNVQLGKSNFNKTFYASENYDYAKSHGGNKSSINEIILDKKANLADMRKPDDKLVQDIQNIIESKPTGKVVKIQKPDGSFIEVPEKKGGISTGVYSTKEIIDGIRNGKAMFSEMPEVKSALKKLGYDGQITQESKYGANYGIWNKDIIKTKSQLTDIWKKANKK